MRWDGRDYGIAAVRRSIPAHALLAFLTCPIVLVVRPIPDHIAVAPCPSCALPNASAWFLGQRFTG